MTLLTCPACQGPMKGISNNGVFADTCTRCGGVWLDRAAVERLAGMFGTENRGFAARPFPPPADRRRRRDDDDDDDDDDRRYRDDDRHHRYDQPRQRRRSILDFFD